MTEEEIRKIYERDGGPLGANHNAINKFIDMLQKFQECYDSNVRSISDNIGKLKDIAPNFMIFETDKSCDFLKRFNAMEISRDSSQIVMAHEFGHGILKMINQGKTPENFEKVIVRARANCISPENRDYFIKYLEHLCNKNNFDRTEAEKGPLSDILSSVFQTQSVTFKSNGKQYIFPSSHVRSYYFDEENGVRKIEQIFDEDFANYLALVSGNHRAELTVLRTLLGDEWIQTMQTELEKAGKNIEMGKEKDDQNQAIENIKQSIIGVREKKIPSTILEQTQDKEADIEHD